MRLPLPLSKRCEAVAFYRGGRCRRHWRFRNAFGFLVCVQHPFWRGA